MAIEDRKPKAERRAEARADRKSKAEQETKDARRRRLISLGSSAGVLIIIAIVLVPTVQRLFGGDTVEDLEITLAAAQSARDEAGCETLVENEPLPERAHLDPAEAPPADILYANAQVRPTYSGSHFNVVSPPISNIPRTPIEERSVVHSMEHAAIAVWFDEDALDPDQQNAMGDWGESRNDLGFRSAAGGNVFTSPYEGTVTSGKPVAFRAWGQAMDCDSFDPVVADAWLIDYWGSHGIAPERNLSPYPEGVLGYGDVETGDTEEGEGPQDDESDPDDAPTDVEFGDSDLPTDGADGASDGASEPASDEATDEPTEGVDATDEATQDATPSEDES